VSSALLVDVNGVHQRLLQLFQKHRITWLRNEGKWPLIIPLGLPSQQIAFNNIRSLGNWIDVWKTWQGSGTVQWCHRAWSFLGKQRLPEKIIFANPLEVMQWLNNTAIWKQISKRHAELIQAWPQLKTFQINTRYFEMLEQYDSQDFDRLQKVLNWLMTHMPSSIYLRQLPIEGIDTKWIENHKAILFDLLSALKKADVTSRDFFELAGFKKEPFLIRVRVLCSSLRDKLNGLSDFCASTHELAKLKISPQKIFIVENLRTGLAFQDIPGAVVFMGLGYAVNHLKDIPWIHSSVCYYWGDIDTHGFAILNRARAHFPHLKSLLMDKEVFFEAREFWVRETSAARMESMLYLTEPEKEMYQHLRDNTWGNQLRLEQERIFWDEAWKIIVSLVGFKIDYTAVPAVAQGEPL
jgi:hypothetical protein